uniref:Uncharacterized protein n=1 Tax=Panagrolaimus sp. PS1159 TaxID=55785 RepID=A0AC35G7P4_9BILA
MFIEILQNFPQQITYFVHNWVEADINEFKYDFHTFEFDDSKKEYLCFRKTIETWMPKDTVFEIRFVK